MKPPRKRRRQSQYYYIAYEQTEEQLPIYVADSVQELSEVTGINKNTILSRINYKGQGSKNSRIGVTKVKKI